MNSSALFVIDADPRASGRPAEAVRIAAGLGVWKRIEVSVYLRDAAVLILGEGTDELVDADNYARYLPLLAESGRPIYVQEGAACIGHLGHNVLRFEEISDASLAQMAANSWQVIRF